MLVLGLAGCGTPEPAEPTPTPAFSSEAEAFAAAEETYRAYVEALNSRHADPSARPAPTDYLIGEALESELDTERLLSEGGRAIVGPAEIAGFTGAESSSDFTEISAVICLDVSKSRVIDESGADVTPADRPDVLALDVEFVFIDSAFAIAASNVADEQTC